MVTDDHPVVAEFIKDPPSEVSIIKSEEWRANHVFESQYLIQIVKCTDVACCSPFQSSYLKVILAASHPSGLLSKWYRMGKR